MEFGQATNRLKFFVQTLFGHLTTTPQSWRSCIFNSTSRKVSLWPPVIASVLVSTFLTRQPNVDCWHRKPSTPPPALPRGSRTGNFVEFGRLENCETYASCMPTPSGGRRGTLVKKISRKIRLKDVGKASVGPSS